MLPNLTHIFMIKEIVILKMNIYLLLHYNVQFNNNNMLINLNIKQILGNIIFKILIYRLLIKNHYLLLHNILF